MTPPGPTRVIHILFQPGWGAPDGMGLLGEDRRIQTLRRVLVSYPEVRHILPDRISLAAEAEPRLLEAVARFLGRQQWLVKSVEVR